MSCLITTNPAPAQASDQKMVEKNEIVLKWRKIFFFVYLHIGAFVGLYQLVTTASTPTINWVFFLEALTTQGVTVGAHRLWCHRSFKARLPLRIYLAIGQTLAYQTSIYHWVRDHRTHHKYSDTEADPHNASRGFFFSHMGWLMVKRSEVSINRGRKIDMSDLEADPVVRCQKKYYWHFVIIGLILPTFVPWYFWGESLSVAWHTGVLFRYCLTLHYACCVNSVAHIWGTKPYDKNIRPVETMWVSQLTWGEGFHNYHHTFPWDYKAAELGSYYGNWNTLFIDFMAKIGQAYELKCASAELVEKRARRAGDGSRHLSTKNIWGWGDKDIEKEDVKMAKIAHQK